MTTIGEGDAAFDDRAPVTGPGSVIRQACIAARPQA
jgi:hypothetical protein